MYKIKKYESAPQNFFAGEFPTLTDAGTAAEALAEHTLVYVDSNGKIAAATQEKAAEATGITADAAEADGPVVYYITGEFFADAVKRPAEITTDTLKPILRKLNIFLR